MISTWHGFWLQQKQIQVELLYHWQWFWQCQKQWNKMFRYTNFWTNQRAQTLVGGFSLFHLKFNILNFSILSLSCQTKFKYIGEFQILQLCIFPSPLKIKLLEWLALCVCLLHLFASQMYISLFWSPSQWRQTCVLVHYVWTELKRKCLTNLLLQHLWCYDHTVSIIMILVIIIWNLFFAILINLQQYDRCSFKYPFTVSDITNYFEINIH